MGGFLLVWCALLLVVIPLGAALLAPGSLEKRTLRFAKYFGIGIALAIVGFMFGIGSVSGGSKWGIYFAFYGVPLVMLGIAVVEIGKANLDEIKPAAVAASAEEQAKLDALRRWKRFILQSSALGFSHAEIQSNLEERGVSAEDARIAVAHFVPASSEGPDKKT